MFARLIKET